MKHTKGEWEVKEGKAYDSIVNGKGHIIATSQCENVGNWQANAQLISAAPDLLEALKNAVVDSEQKLTQQERKARAEYYKQAIAKAEKEGK